GLATFREVLTRESYAHVDKLSKKLTEGYRAIVKKSGLQAYVASAGVNGALMLYPQEIRNYRDWTKIDVDLWRHYWFGMVNRGVLGWWDLVLLFVVAVFNLNVVPSIAANGGVTVWLWIISLALFFWPQGIAVVELAHRYPGEGGVYLWAKEVFGDFHGFLSGWCYWTNNMMYVPTIMLYFVGVFVFVLGAGHESLADNKSFALTASLILLVLLVVLNIVGLGVGKWV